MNKKNNNDIEFILVEHSHSGNIGACARAIKNMGFKKLGIVKPRKTITKEAPRHPDNKDLGNRV